MKCFKWLMIVPLSGDVSESQLGLHCGSGWMKLELVQVCEQKIMRQFLWRVCRRRGRLTKSEEIYLLNHKMDLLWNIIGLIQDSIYELHRPKLGQYTLKITVKKLGVLLFKDWHWKIPLFLLQKVFIAVFPISWMNPNPRSRESQIHNNSRGILARGWN